MTKLTPLERKIVRRAAELVATHDCNSLAAIAAVGRVVFGPRFRYEGLKSKFLCFYDRYDCPLAYESRSEELRTTRVLLLLTFLHFDGVIE